MIDLIPLIDCCGFGVYGVLTQCRSSYFSLWIMVSDMILIMIMHP